MKEKVKNNVVSFLVENGFQVEEQSPSNSFGDYLISFFSKNLIIRIISDKQQVSIEISSNQEGTIEWFDLTLLMADLDQEIKLTEDVNVDQKIFFLQNKLNKVIDLFNPLKYKETRDKLMILADKRKKEMLEKFRKRYL